MNVLRREGEGQGHGVQPNWKRMENKMEETAGDTVDVVVKV